MSMSAKRRDVLGLVLAALGFLILLGLGTWQVQRLMWKTELIETIERQMALPPAPLPAEVADPEDYRYRRVTVEGVFHHDKEIHLFAHSRAGEPGFQIITPLERPDGSYVLVNRGWVPEALKEPAKRPQGQVSGRVTVTGIGRPSWQPAWLHRWIVPDNRPGTNLWFYGDLGAMAAHLGITEYAPIFIEADATPNPGGWPQGGQTRIEIRNDHLQYALTWYALAVALVVMFVLARRRRLSEPVERSRQT